MRIREIITEAPITNDPEDDPWGLTGYNRNIDYEGLRVLMRPSKFLELSLPLGDAELNPQVAGHIEKGGNIASPFLIVKLPDAWLDDTPDYLRAARVMQHEGRNRMKSWLKKHGDDPVEVHILFRDALKRRDITDRMIRELRRGLHNESTKLGSGQGEYVTNTFSEVLN